ncbi:MAG: FmdE family protein [Canidatus Methanoxibalbensis ujae]|nr:FmdE family protein [Candidatus Methanoxibalbensis ujae]
MMMRRIFGLIWINVMLYVMMLCVVSAAMGSGGDGVGDGVGDGDDDMFYLIGRRAAEIAMRELPFERGDKNTLLMTTASYAIIDGRTTERSVDGVSDASGCTIGNGNLLIIHKMSCPLWFAFFKKDTKDCVYIEVNSEAIAGVDRIENLSDDRIFKIVRENIGHVLEKPEVWNDKINSKVFGGNEFSIITISTVWERGVPYDLLQAGKFHNHFCPGLLSGYMIVKFVEKKLPLSEGECYQVIAVPPWCKDDAVQIMTDATVGHKQMAVKTLTEKQRKHLKDNNVAGIFIRWNKKEKCGDAAVVSFNWDKVYEIAGVNRSDFRSFDTYKWWWARLKTNLALLEHLENNEFVSIVREFRIESADELDHLKSAGVNPLEELGLTNKAMTKAHSAHVISTSLAIIVAAFIFAKKRKARICEK